MFLGGDKSVFLGKEFSFNERIKYNRRNKKHYKKLHKEALHQLVLRGYLNIDLPLPLNTPYFGDVIMGIFFIGLLLIVFGIGMSILLEDTFYIILLFPGFVLSLISTIFIYLGTKTNYPLTQKGQEFINELKNKNINSA
ncbi:MAG: hypothetical protein AAB636_01535 [Patescibacteria group bacterium]